MMATKTKKDPEESKPPSSSANGDPPAAVTSRRNKGGADAVADLERRLRLLEEFGPSSGGGGGDASMAATAAAPSVASSSSSEAAPANSVATATPAAKTSGKNALLARIMAAQEKAKQAQAATATTSTATAAAVSRSSSTGQDPPPAFDLLDSTFNHTAASTDPPPSFDVSLLPPQSHETAPPPPPAFDDSILPPPPPNMMQQQQFPFGGTMMFDPLAAPVQQHDDLSFMASAPPAPSAPALEDVYAMPPPPAWEAHAPLQQYEQDELQTSNFVEQPNNNNNDRIDPAALDAIMSLDGLSDADKRALIDEQLQILREMKQQQQQQTTSSASVSAADAFEQRSLAMSLRQQQQPTPSRNKPTITKVSGTHAGIPTDASLASQVQEAQSRHQSNMVSIGSGQQVPLHGPERTQQAIQSGVAVIVQCLGCEHAMQVTPAASLMFCPVCETVSAVNDNNVMSMSASDDAAAQLEADMKFAEQLQKEEYKRAGAGDDAGASRSAGQRAAASPSAASGGGGGWMEWLGMSSAAGASPTAPAALNATGSASRSSLSRGSTGLVAANTETVNFVPNDSMQQARVAEAKPLFSCVADSIMTTANQYMASTLMDAPDEEGNVHGVDSSSLLAMPMSGVGRNAGGKSEDPNGYHAYGN